MEEYNNLIRDVFYANFYARYEHWLTFSFARHKGTEYFYDTIMEQLDSLVEHIGSDLRPAPVQMVFDDEERTFEDVLQDLRNTINLFRHNTEVVTMEIEDILLDMLNTIRQTQYLLKLM